MAHLQGYPPFTPHRLTVATQAQEVHCLTAACGPYRLIAVLQPQSPAESAGVIYFAHEETQALPAWQPPLIPRPADLPSELVHSEAVALGPIYREADASWLPIAGLPTTWFDAELDVAQESGPCLAWSVQWRVYGGPTVSEDFLLSEAGLEYRCALQWSIPGFRVQFPAFLTDGQHIGVPQPHGPTLYLRTSAWRLVAECLEPTDAVWSLETITPTATPCHYARALLQSRSAVQYRLKLSLACQPAG
jgi:hypothetical protein